MRVSDQVAQQVLQLIQQQHIKVGQALPAERKLCEQLGVSRASLREAIQQLTSQGIIRSKVGAGHYVQQLPSHWSNDQVLQPLSQLIDTDPNYRFDVQEARIALEGATAWHAAQRASTADIAKIKYYYSQMQHFQSLGDDDQSAQADANFHLAIAEASHNIVLIQMMRGVFDLLQFNVLLGRRKLYSETYRFDRLQEQHSQVLDAIERRDPEAARQAVCGHIEFVVQQVRCIDEEDARRQRASRLNRTSL
ncbi:transcriptional regulator LldR [Acinetobacter larvae]|nr:transcriptional regulator LldR [Acinetobacter larvae]